MVIGMWLGMVPRQPCNTGSARFWFEGTNIGDRERFELDRATDILEMQSLRVALQDQPFQKAPTTPMLLLQMIMSAS